MKPTAANAADGSSPDPAADPDGQGRRGTGRADGESVVEVKDGIPIVKSSQEQSAAGNGQAQEADRRPSIKDQPLPKRPLDGRDILIDTYNLRLKHGSGIKTYGMTLAEAVHDAGASVSLLGDRAVATTGKRGLDEVLFYDHPRGGWRLLRGIRNVGRGVRRLLGPVEGSAIANRYVIPDRSFRAVPGTRAIYNVGNIYETANESFRRFGRWTTVKLPDKVDLWHATTLLPIRVRGVPMVTTVHDVIPLRLPYTTLDDKRFFYRITGDAMRMSDLVFTVSECTKRDLLLFYPDTPPEKIVVTHQAVPFHLYQRDEASEDTVMKRYGVTRGKYFLFVGNIEPKKNLRALAQAVGSMNTDIPLVVVGRKGWLYKEEMEAIESSFGRKWQRHVHLLDFVPRHDLHALYACAKCLVFPSLYEGFGLPPLEAFAHGCPVICSDVASLPEVCGDAALYCDPYNPESIRHRLEQVLEDDALRSEMIRRGYDRLDEFSTVRYAERLTDAYQRVL